MSKASEELDRVELRKQWVRGLDQALQADGWGQIVEALEAYERVLRMINGSIESLRPSADLRALLNKTVLCVDMRSKALSAETEAAAKAGPTIDQMKLLSPWLRTLFADDEMPFPIDVSRLGGGRKAVALTAATEEKDAERGGSLLPAPTLVAGKEFISIEIEKWGLKDAETYVDPFVTVCVYDADGKAVESPQDTPIAEAKKHPYVLFNKRVYIQTSLDELRRDNAGIFFEFKHCKPKKDRYISTRCWAFMEMDEVREGGIQLEGYKKPTDPRRKTIKLFSIKDLFLHLRITVHAL